MHMKKQKTIFWITTAIIFIMEGVLPALTGHSEMSVSGITRLGYPLYFVTIMVVFKVLGSVALIVPRLPVRVKEWAYAGFGIDFVIALISLWVVDGFSIGLLIPVVFMVLLVLSYRSYHKIHA